MIYAVVLSNSNAHIVKLNFKNEFEVIGFAAGENNLEAIKDMVDLANANYSVRIKNG